MAIGKQSLSRVKNAANGGAACLPQNAIEPSTAIKITVKADSKITKSKKIENAIVSLGQQLPFYLL